MRLVGLNSVAILMAHETVWPAEAQKSQGRQHNEKENLRHEALPSFPPYPHALQVSRSSGTRFA